jgi:hypothetical protein
LFDTYKPSQRVSRGTSLSAPERINNTSPYEC